MIDHDTLRYAPIHLREEVFELRKTHPQTYPQMDGHYQVHYLPRFAVDKDLQLPHLPLDGILHIFQ